MLVTSIERELGCLPLAKELIAPRARTAQASTREQAMAAPPQPEAPQVSAADLTTDLDGLAQAHCLSEERVAALLADPLA